MRRTYLLLHLANLKLMRAELSIILRLSIIAVLLRNNILDLANKFATRSTNSLASRLKTVLSLAHESSLDAAGGDKLGSAGSDVVRGDDELFRGVAARDDAVGCLDEGIRRSGDGLGG